MTISGFCGVAGDLGVAAAGAETLGRRPVRSAITFLEPDGPRAMLAAARAAIEPAS